MVLFFGYSAEAAPFARALQAAGVRVPLLTPDTVHDSQFPAQAGSAAEGVYVALPDPTPSGAAYERFSAAYVAAYGASAAAAPFTPQAFDATAVLADALRRVARPAGSALTIDLTALRAAVARTDLTGASGRVRFDALGDNVGTATPVRILVVRESTFVDTGF